MHDVSVSTRPVLGGTSRWVVEPLTSDTERAQFAAVVRERLHVRELSHDVEWLEAARARDGDEQILAFANRSSGALTGVLVGRISSNVLKYTVGNLVLLQKRVREVQIFQTPVCADGDRQREMTDAMWSVWDAMPPRSVVYANAVVCESDFHVLLAAMDSPLRARFHVLKWGAANWHCKIDWHGTLDAYLASLGADSRRNLKRYSKKLFSNEALQPAIMRFQTAGEIDRFLEDGIKVSEKTYQSRLLGLGLSRGGAFEQRVRFAAARQGFLGHILYLRGEPVAFHYGFVYGETFFAVAMGYDPSVSQHQPGSVLFFLVLDDVEKLKLPVDTIDCLPVVTDFKLRTTNRKVQIQNFYLFKKDLAGTILYGWIKMLDGTATWLRGLADRANLTERLRRRFSGLGR